MILSRDEEESLTSPIFFYEEEKKRLEKEYISAQQRPRMTDIANIILHEETSKYFL